MWSNKKRWWKPGWKIILAGIIMIGLGFISYNGQREEERKKDKINYVVSYEQNEVLEPLKYEFLYKIEQLRSSRNFSSIYFAKYINNAYEIAELTKDNITTFEYAFLDNSYLNAVYEKNEVGLVKTSLQIDVNNMNFTNNFYTFDIIIKGEDNKYQFNTMIYYFILDNNEYQIKTILLKDDDVYNHEKLRPIATELSNNLNINMTLNDLSLYMVQLRENLKNNLKTSE